MENGYPRSRESGAVLLVIMLIVIVGSASFLITQLNQYANVTHRQSISIKALSEARQALIGWAVNHPVNPGTLPIPDRNTDGDYDGDSDCYNDVDEDLPPDHLSGRLPWRSAPAPCKDAGSLTGLGVYPLDDSGEMLWYAVSRNLVYDSPEYPFISVATLSKTSDWITVRDKSGQIISDRVAFVVIAPGSPLPDQDRGGGAPAIGQYLDAVTIGGETYDNADTDQDFIIYPNSDTTSRTDDNFNDRLVFVTIDELMRGVMKRVLNETGNFLAKYHNDLGQSALPWLSPYADPKAEIPDIRGEAHSDSSGTTLVDSGIDFINAGVKDGAVGVDDGDIVHNITDGSVGIIDSVGIPDGNPNNHTLTVSALVSGTDNNFGDGDIYVITPVSNEYVQNYLSGTATAGSDGFLLEDTDKNFQDMGVTPGQIIENVPDSTMAVIAEVSGETITAKPARDGGTDIDFSSGENYRIRTNMGTATSGTANLVLEDTDKNFNRMGVTAGDLIRNITDGSFGVISSVTNTTISVDELKDGTNNVFSDADVYIIPRFNAGENTSEGLLSFHKPGKYFKTGFSVDWNILASSPDDISTDIDADDPHPDYEDDLEDKVERSNGTSGAIDIDSEDGQCIWIRENVVECRGIYMDPAFPVQGTVTSTLWFNPNVLIDSNADFTYVAVKKGDIVVNFDDEDSTAAVTTGTTSPGSEGQILVDNSKNFNALGIIPYYHRVHNLDDSNARGLVTEIIDANTLRVEEFPGWPPMDLDWFGSFGEDYSIYAPQKLVVTNVDSSTRLTTSYLSPGSNPYDPPDPDFDTGEFYQVYLATGRKEGNADNNDQTCLVDGSADFSDIEPGDIVENLTDDAFGIISSVDASNDKLCVYELYTDNGSERDFNDGEGYIIYYNHEGVNRRYKFHARFSGSSDLYAGSDETRKRVVCLGYDTTCTTLSANVDLPQQNAFLTIEDIDVDNNVIGSSTAKTSTVSTTTGSIKVSNIDYYLREGNNEIPEWYVRNKWYQYVYLAYSDRESPGQTGICASGTDCLELNIGSNSRNDIRALVMLTGDELGPQSQVNADIGDYYDVADNTDGDRIFSRKTDDVISGTATSGSSGLTLEDTSKDFIDLGVVAGNIVINTDDGPNGSRGIVQSRTTSQITVNSLNGGAENDFDDGDAYQILNNDMIRIATSCPSDATRLCWSK